MKDYGRVTTLRLDKDDERILAWLQKHLGLRMAQVVKIALRRLYAIERADKQKRAG